uniref:Toll-like receptor 2 n=1 Tax=Tupaia chinensis TaxID=246437 RepID=A0A140H1B6_TUPCH|nr:TLR2 [Tupaia chinensis]
MPHAWWTVWTLGAAISLFREGARGQVTLSCDASGVCDGRSRSLRSIPSGLTAAVRSLDLSDNNITHVGDRDLQRCVNLKSLVLRSSGINTIDEDAFSPLVSLELLDLSYNHLLKLSSSWFRSLTSLRFLYLLGNPYKTLGETSLFSHLTRLQILSVGNSYTFTELQRKDFAGLTSLKELEIDASSLQSYEPRSLRSIENISHLILRMRRPLSLLEIFDDLLSSVEHLELRDTYLDTFRFSKLFIREKNPLLKKLTFRNVEITDDSFSELAKLLFYASRLSDVEFDDCTLNGVGDFSVSALSKVKDSGKIETLTVRRLHIPKFYLFYDLSSIYSLTENVKRITIENSKVFLVPCSLSRCLTSLEYLDLSENLMVEEYLENSACEEAWPSLQTLILRQNHLTLLEKTGEVLLTLKNLTSLDVSKNSFHSMPETCRWPEKLERLNLSSTRLRGVTPCLPRTLAVLDLSDNELTAFSLLLPQLRELYISKNKLKMLPAASAFPSLLVMKVSRNTITAFSKEQLDSFRQLQTLEAGDNSFICSCDFLAFMQAQPAPTQALGGWPNTYVCDSPSHLRGQLVRDARLSPSECHKVALVSGVCCALCLLLLLTVGLCHRFHGLWYLRMTWAWLQAKRKPRRAPARPICYDAFVSYSERDAGWVEDLLVRELERGDAPLRLCLHKRDFVPGKWIIDNIIDSIERSRKTVFVLSENFVRSEWCKYELDFSHFRLFDENDDAAVLVLLEPLEKKAIPQRFCRLRRVMNTRTYLEWPAAEAEQPAFWASLRATLQG